MSRGRPSKYKPEYCQLLIEHMEKGFSFESFAGIVGTCRQTIYTWTEDYPEFLDAKKEASGRCQVFWEEQGLKGLWNQHQGKNLNTSNWIFQMKNRFGWKDRVESEHSVSEKVEKLVIDLGESDDSEERDS